LSNFLLAGGGTAGHVNPLLSLADAIKADSPDSQVWALGTREGLESRLVPARGHELLTIAKVPFPRKLNSSALMFPFRFVNSVAQCLAIIRGKKIDVVVGFGGYASAPAYVAARISKVPIVVHEANALPGWANKLGAKWASAVGVAFKNTPLNNGFFVGMPLRREIENLVSSRDVAKARQFFGLETDAPTLLVTGGSLGARRINQAIDASRKILTAAGIQVLHIVGDKSEFLPMSEQGYLRIGYCDRMDLAIAAADLAVSRSGASTVSEFAAVGLPAVFVPYPVGNGEQALNAAELVAVGGAQIITDQDFTAEYVASELVSLASDNRRIKQMAEAAMSVGVVDGTARLLAMVKGVLKSAS
jgi:UDP-N-acetylglucosamine--N-acetylmuramyl-(pentapeptide) pyrophosphoryl-undecaprenol N-acetylglucosamine transferase